MPLSDLTRIDRLAMSPQIVQLWQALAPLKTVVSFMNTGAHPDDETSAMLAALGFRDGLDLSFACSTRGEGGQNNIGQEATQSLGVLRTAEMERAADVLNLRLYWLSETPDDTIFDFGFSKSGVETLEKWGRARTLKRFVDILRTERPDIICPTFLDVPGQHGHHRAMTEAAHLVMDLAADRSFTDSTLPPWQVRKMYLPAWSGAGQSYDDDLPPPPATLKIDASGLDPITGFSFEQIGQMSRACHRTQGMGKWVPAGAERDWPLHLADSRVNGPDTDIFSGLPKNLRDLGGATLDTAQQHIDAALEAFPACDDIVKHCSVAADLLASAKTDPDQLHKINRKRTQLARVIRIAAGVQVIARTGADRLRPNAATRLDLETRAGAAERIEVSPVLPEGWSAEGDTLRIGPNLSDPYPATYLPDTPSAPCLSVKVTAHGVTTESAVPFEVTPVVVPTVSAAITPLADVLNIRSSRREVAVTLGDVGPEEAALTVPAGWSAAKTETGFVVSAPAEPEPRRYEFTLLVNGTPAQTVRDIAHPHTAPRALAQPATINLQVLDVALPNVKIGYIGGGNDRVDFWLGRMGMDVTPLSSADLQSETALAAYNTILIGIFAMKFRTGLAARMPRLHDWCNSGGTLVTLYHRPWDNWDPDTIPPKRIEVGQPSLRWRVTDEAAEVTHLVPDHPILTTPNKIGPADWANWHKERGLYFAKSWDAAYEPLLEMSDPGEAPHRGALLAADIGQGRHIHSSLILHHQMEKLTPGAFRLMANFLAKRS